MTADILVSRLAGVRETGQGRWLAKCPAHEDKRPSLSVRELPDGRVLVHCFGACHVGDVLTAVGLSLTDLFPDGVRDTRLRPSKSRIPASDLILLLDEEATLVGLLAAQFLERQAITEGDWGRLATAVSRIGKVAAYIGEGHR